MKHFALIALLAAAPAHADPVPGADDPAFRLPFERALQSDDPQVLRDLHTAAESGNTAALMALPAVSGWLRGALPFADRKALARVNGVPLAEAVAAADQTAALWNMGDLSGDPAALLQSSFGLYAAGEGDKATLQFFGWLNHTGGTGPLPADFLDQPVPDWAMAIVLKSWMDNDAARPATETDALLATLLKTGKPAAPMALAAFAGLDRPDAPPADTARISAIIKASGMDQAKVAAAMAESVPVLKTIMRFDWQVLDATTAEKALATLRDKPELAPLMATCQAICPSSRDACATAYLAGLGNPFYQTSGDQPFVALISTEDFFATPRGQEQFMLSTQAWLGASPEASPALTAARAINDCFTDAVLASFT